MPMEFHPVDRNPHPGTSTGTIDGSGANPEIAWWLDSDTLTSDPSFYFDTTNKTVFITGDPTGGVESLVIARGDVPSAAFSTAILTVTDTTEGMDLIQGQVGVDAADLTSVFDLSYDGDATAKNGQLILYSSATGSLQSRIVFLANGNCFVGRSTNSLKLGINDNTPSHALDVNGTIASQKRIFAALVVVTPSATPAFDASLANTFTMVLTANVTSSTVTNALTGQVIRLVLTQDGTGSRTMVWPTNFRLAGGAFTLTTTVSKSDTITVVYDGTNWLETARTVNL